MKLVPKTLCLAPWTHTYLSPQTERRMCYASADGLMLKMKICDLDRNRRQNLKDIEPEFAALLDLI
jgi:hypothetical protein